MDQLGSTSFVQEFQALSGLLRDPDAPEIPKEGVSRPTAHNPGAIGPSELLNVQVPAPRPPTVPEPLKPAAKKDPKAIWDEDEITDAVEDDVDDGREVPVYEFMYKQAVATTDVFLGMSGKDESSTSCEDMVLRIELPGVESAAELDLDVKRTYVKLSHARYKLSVHTPHPVNEDKGKAQWDAKKHVLSVTLPIVREDLVALTLNKLFYEPSDPVHATVKICNDPDAAPQRAHIKELVFQAWGHERTDPAWISKLWRAECKPEATENRRNVRTIFRTEAATLLANSDLLPGASRLYHLRFRLPVGLPPSFKGSSVRFTYTLEVRAVYELRAGLGLPASTFETLATSNLLVWPPHAWPKPPGPAGPLPGSELSTPHPSLSQPLHGAFSGRPGSGGMAEGNGTGAGPGPGTASSSAGGASAGGADDLQDLPMLEYRPHQLGVKVRFLDITSPSPTNWPSPTAASAAAAAAAVAASALADGPQPAGGSSSLTSSPAGPGAAAMAGFASMPPTPSRQLALQLQQQQALLGPPQGGISGMPSFSQWGVPSPPPPLRPASHFRSGSGGAEGVASPLRFTPTSASGSRLSGAASASTAAAAGPSGPGVSASPGAIELPTVAHHLAPTPFMNSHNGLGTGGFAGRSATGRPAAAGGPGAGPLQSAGGGSSAGRPSSSAGGGGLSLLNDASDDSDPEGQPSRHSHRHLSTGTYASAKSLQQAQAAQQRHLRVSESSGASGGGEAAGGPGGAGGGPGGGAFAPAAALPWPPRGGSLGAAAQAFSKSFMLSASGQPVLKLTLQAPLDGHLQPGTTFGGLLDFRFPAAAASNASNAVCCHHVAVMLETEELVAAAYSTRAPGSGGARGGQAQGRVMRVLQCEHQEITSDVATSSFVFTLPSAATPSFRTPMVSLRWVLRFELLVGPPTSHAAAAAHDGSSEQAQRLQQGQGSMPKGTATVTSDLDFLVDDSRSGALDKDTVDLFVERVRAALDRQGYDVQLVEKGTVAWPHFEVVTPTKLELEGEVVFASVVRTSDRAHRAWPGGGGAQRAVKAMKLLVWEASTLHDMPKLKGVVLEGLARHLIKNDASLLRDDHTGFQLFNNMLLCLACLGADDQPSRQLRETVEAALGHELRAWALQDQEVWRWADLAADTHARLATGGYGMHEVELLRILTAAEYQP